MSRKYFTVSERKLINTPQNQKSENAHTFSPF